MKKFFAVLLAVMILMSVGMTAVCADDASAAITVTISDKDGKLAVAAEPITVTDRDEDGALTVNDALIAAHDTFYEGGAAAGYATETTQYGLGIKTLWGSTNGGSYGYYVNNASAWSLADPIQDGDYLAAFVYTDLVKWSDQYSYFDKVCADVKTNGKIKLTLSAASYDEEWNPITVACANAAITVDGEKIGVTTDFDGKATIVLPDAGTHIVSAVSTQQTLVPPVFHVNVFKAADVTVTITDKDGKLAVAAKDITVTDQDEDNALTINDALIAAHDAFYEGGAAAGYATESSQYGLGIKTLWGSTNGGSYGYYLNNTAAWSLADPIQDGDYLAAFVYTDLTAWSDKLGYFDSFAADTKAGETIELTLSAAGFDAEGNPYLARVSNAAVTVDGKATDITTDDQGKATLTLSDPGSHIISAVSADMRLVPPVFRANVYGRGDADKDLVISIMDVTCIQRYLADLIKEDEILLSAADADNDNVVSILDATRLQRFLANLSDMDGNAPVKPEATESTDATEVTEATVADETVGSTDLTDATDSTDTTAATDTSNTSESSAVSETASTADPE